MFGTHYKGNPVAYKWKVDIIHRIANLFSSLSLLQESYFFFF